MIDTKVRDKAQPLFNYCAMGFKKLGVSANKVTIAAFIIGILSGVFISMDRYFWGIILLWISGFLDVIDGSLARITKTSSGFGAYMDLIFDRLVESGVILGFFFSLPQNELAYLLFFVAVLFNFTTFIVAGALFENLGEKSIYYDVGIAERTETFIVFTMMMLWPKNSGIILLVFDFVVVLTGLIRFYKIAKFFGKEVK
ncbi:MAG: CDP-alcohol phosphatidyltransferase family protein [Filifactoraceae bacterium]